MNIHSTYSSTILSYSLKNTYTYTVKNDFIWVCNFWRTFVLN